MNLRVNVYTQHDTLPDISDGNFFHSVELFQIIGATPGHQPLLAVAFDEDGRAVAHLQACIRRRKGLLPPYLFAQGRIYGEGFYASDLTLPQRDEAFGLLLEAITRKFQRRLCLYAELSNVSQKMFGYRHLRRLGYFPISWQEIHNSLHNIPPRDRLSPTMVSTLNNLQQCGLETRRAMTDVELRDAYRLLRRYNRMRWRHFIPPQRFFTAFNQSEQSNVLITTHEGKIVGVSASVYTHGDAYLWYMAASRLPRHAGTGHAGNRQALLMLTTWEAIDNAYRHNCSHFYFMDAGLPFRHSAYRDFLLGFGGKPVAKFRWFRCSLKWANHFFSWIYRE